MWHTRCTQSQQLTNGVSVFEGKIHSTVLLTVILPNKHNISLNETVSAYSCISKKQMRYFTLIQWESQSKGLSKGDPNDQEIKQWTFNVPTEMSRLASKTGVWNETGIFGLCHIFSYYGADDNLKPSFCRLIIVSRGEWNCQLLACLM